MMKDENHNDECAVLVAVYVQTRGLTQRRIGELLGISQESVSTKLRGTRKLHVGDIYKLASVLDISVTDLMPEGEYAQELIEWARKNRPRLLRHSHD